MNAADNNKNAKRLMGREKEASDFCAMLPTHAIIINPQAPYCHHGDFSKSLFSEHLKERAFMLLLW
jgi:hypothetical protein